MPGFGDRLEYLLWVQPLTARRYLPKRKLAALIAVEPSWVTKWLKRPDSPNDRLLEARFRAVFPGETEWLLDGVGEPPVPFVWDLWAAAHGFPARGRADIPLRPPGEPVVLEQERPQRGRRRGGQGG